MDQRIKFAGPQCYYEDEGVFFALVTPATISPSVNDARGWELRVVSSEEEGVTRAEVTFLRDKRGEEWAEEYFWSEETEETGGFRRR